MRRSSQVAFVCAWTVYLATVILAWRKVLAVPDDRGDSRGLLVATVAGFFGLALLMVWLQDYERDRCTCCFVTAMGPTGSPSTRWRHEATCPHTARATDE